MTDPRLLQDDSPEIAEKIRAAKVLFEQTTEDKKVRDLRAVGLNDAEIAAKLDAQTEAYEAEQVRDYGKLAQGAALDWRGGLAMPSYLHVSDYQIRHDALKLATTFEGVDCDGLIDIATTFEAYLRGETKIESETVVGEGTGG